MNHPQNNDFENKSEEVKNSDITSPLVDALSKHFNQPPVGIDLIP